MVHLYFLLSKSKLRGIGLLGMFIPVEALVKIVEASRSDPSSLTVGLFLGCQSVLVHHWEGAAQEVIRISIVMLPIIGNDLAHLLLLELPNVLFLIPVRIELCLAGRVYARLLAPTWAVILNLLRVRADEVL